MTSRVTVEGTVHVSMMRVSKRSNRYVGPHSLMRRDQTKMIADRVMIVVEEAGAGKAGHYVFLVPKSRAQHELEGCHGHRARVTYTPKQNGPSSPPRYHRALRANVECLDVGEHVLAALGG
jgi:hypothetical protein